MDVVGKKVVDVVKRGIERKARGEKKREEWEESAVVRIQSGGFDTGGQEEGLVTTHSENESLHPRDSRQMGSNKHEATHPMPDTEHTHDDRGAEEDRRMSGP